MNNDITYFEATNAVLLNKDVMEVMHQYGIEIHEMYASQESYNSGVDYGQRTVLVKFNHPEATKSGRYNILFESNMNGLKVVELKHLTPALNDHIKNMQDKFITKPNTKYL